jgi:hypothetical protein
MNPQDRTRQIYGAILAMLVADTVQRVGEETFFERFGLLRYGRRPPPPSKLVLSMVNMTWEACLAAMQERSDVVNAIQAEGLLTNPDALRNLDTWGSFDLYALQSALVRNGIGYEHNGVFWVNSVSIGDKSLC